MNASRLLRWFRNGLLPGGGLALVGVLSLMGTPEPASNTLSRVQTPANPHRSDPWVLPTGEPALPSGDVAGPVRRHCSLCHSFDYITTQPPLGRAGWTASIEKMKARYGAPIPTNDVPLLVDYLVKHHGRE